MMINGQFETTGFSWEGERIPVDLRLEQTIISPSNFPNDPRELLPPTFTYPISPHVIDATDTSLLPISDLRSTDPYFSHHDYAIVPYILALNEILVQYGYTDRINPSQDLVKRAYVIDHDALHAMLGAIGYSPADGLNTSEDAVRVIAQDGLKYKSPYKQFFNPSKVGHYNRNFPITKFIPESDLENFMNNMYKVLDATPEEYQAVLDIFKAATKNFTIIHREDIFLTFDKGVGCVDVIKEIHKLFHSAIPEDTASEDYERYSKIQEARKVLFLRQVRLIMAYTATDLESAINMAEEMSDFDPRVWGEDYVSEISSIFSGPEYKVANRNILVQENTSDASGGKDNFRQTSVTFVIPKINDPLD